MRNCQKYAKGYRNNLNLHKKPKVKKERIRPQKPEVKPEVKEEDPDYIKVEITDQDVDWVEIVQQDYEEINNEQRQGKGR